MIILYQNKYGDDFLKYLNNENIMYSFTLEEDLTFFEKDIVDLFNKKNEYLGRYIVVFKYSSYKLVHIHYEKNDLKFSGNGKYKYEILGNIYQNPEYLL